MKTGHLSKTLLIIAVIAGLVGIHGTIIYFSPMHFITLITITSSAVVLLILKHIGLLGALYTRMRRRSSRL